MQRRILVFLIQKIINLRKNLNVALKSLRRHLYFMDFENRDDDIYIVSFPKSGTTWLQVIAYNILTDGNMNFKHIYDVSPWPSNQALLGKTAEEVNQLPSPRIFKSHDEYGRFDESMKSKVIYVYRDVKDVAVSFYHHNKNYSDPKLTFDKNLDLYFFDDSGLNWFTFNKKWLENKHKFTILYVSYESLKNDFENTVYKIAEFLAIRMNDEIMDRVKRHASFEYMKANEQKFGEVKPENPLVYNEFIRKGEIGEGKKYLSEEQQKKLNHLFNTKIAPYMPK